MERNYLYCPVLDANEGWQDGRNLSPSSLILEYFCPSTFQLRIVQNGPIETFSQRSECLRLEGLDVT